MSQVIQIAGSLLILVPFVLARLGRLAPPARSDTSANFVASTVLALEAAHGRQWGFLLLEGVWAIVSLLSLVRHRRVDAPGAAPDQG